MAQDRALEPWWTQYTEGKLFLNCVVPPRPADTKGFAFKRLVSFKLTPNGISLVRFMSASLSGLTNYNRITKP
ncbi:MAG: hypothetical protein DMG15_24330 [Acidobacteria bacterium]|nr:MAG: hypothetical protein DMG15_24330 [Acidobacteriota bacterium]